MFKKLFGKGSQPEKNIEIVAPIAGSFIAIEDIPDPVFAQKMMGEGFGIRPSNGLVVAPVDGEIINVFPTKHAIGIKANNGVELLIHVGLETVTMKGDGFNALVTQGDQVTKGDALLEFDIKKIEEQASSIISPVIITNSDTLKSITTVAPELLIQGETIVLSVETN